MKKWMTIMLLLFAMAVNAEQTESEKLFESARTAYEKKDFEKAFAIYEGLVRENIQDPALFFNFGNTLYQLDLKAKALVYFEKAMLLQPGDKDASGNLKRIRTELGLEDETPQGLIYSLKQFTFLPYLALLFFWIGVFAITAFILFARDKKRKIILIPAMFTLLLGICLGFLSWQNYRDQQPNTFAIAIADAAMYAQPAQLSAEVYEVVSGQKVRILKTEGNWAHIKLHNNRKAWVLKSELVFI